jgi:hypothetical protein
MSSKSKSTAQPAHPSTEEHDDTVEAHYASLERPHACIGGWVFVGYIDDNGEREKRPTGAAVARKTSRYPAGRGIHRGVPALTCL